MNSTQIILKNPDRIVHCEKVISSTKQAGDINNLGRVAISYTNELTCPPTQDNLQNFGLAQILGSGSNIPYTKQACKLVDDGIEILRDGLCILKGFDTRGQIRINIMPAVYDFWDAIAGKNISDLSFEGANDNPADWRSTTIDSYRNATDAVVTPVINYGDFDYTSGGAPAFGGAGAYLPSVYYHTILTHIIENAGYTKTGDIFADTKYLKHILPFGRPEFTYAAKFLTDRTAIVRAAGGQSIVNPVTPQPIDFTTIVQDDVLGFYDGTNKYTPADSDGNAAGAALFGLRIKCTLNITVAGGTVVFGVQDQAGTLWDMTSAGAVGTGEHTFDTFSNLNTDTMPGINGTWYRVVVVASTGTPTVTVNAGTGATFAPHEVPPGPSDWNGGANQYLYANALLPDISQKEFIKDFCIRFGQDLFEKDGVIIAKGKDAIIADKANAKKWTGKRNTDMEPEQAFTPLEYAQTNYLRYNRGDALVAETFGRGTLSIANENIPSQKTLWTSPFSNCATQNLATITMAITLDVPSIAAYPSVGSVNRIVFEQQPVPRILMIRDKRTGEATVGYPDGGQASYKVAYFDDARETNSMNLQQALETYYPKFTAALQKARMINVEYDLNAVDFAAFDFTVPIFDTDSYYLVNVISNFVSGLRTKVQLLKL